MIVANTKPGDDIRVWTSRYHAAAKLVDTGISCLLNLESPLTSLTRAYENRG